MILLVPEADESHFATPNTDAEGNWRSGRYENGVKPRYCATSDKWRERWAWHRHPNYSEIMLNYSFIWLSHNGNEVCFATIGDSATSEGLSGKR